MARTHHDIDMLSGPLFGKMLTFSLPIMALNLLQLLFSFTNMVVVGNFSGEKALAAVGATGALVNLLVTLFMGLSAGVSVVVAQEHGAGKPAEVSRTVHTAICISFVAGIVVMLAGQLFSKAMLEWMDTPPDIILQSELYLRIYFFSSPAGLVYNFGAAILRAVGDSRRPMYYLIAAGILNVILNLFLVIVLHLSVAGVAWATVASEYFALVLIMICLMRSEGAIRVIPKQLRIDFKKLKSIVRIGLPAGTQGLFFSISNVLIQSAVNSFGSTMVAASAAAGNVEGLIGTTMNAYYTAAITFSGQNMGAKKYDRIDSVAKVSTSLIFVTWIILGGAIMLFGRTLLGFYASDPAVIDLGMQRMVVLMAAYFTCGFMNVFPGITRGMGYSVGPMLCTLVGVCLLRIVWLQTVFAWMPTVTMLFACYPVTWGLSGIGQVGIYLFARKRIRRRDAEPGEMPCPVEVV